MMIHLQKTKILTAFVCMLVCPKFAASSASAGGYTDIIVDQNGSGNFRTITEAVGALPMYPYRRTVIYVKNGIYPEKLRIAQNYITLRGENRDSTIIRFSQLRSDYAAEQDGIGPAVVNIHGDDMVLDNLTIENSQPEIGPHAFAVYGDATRTVITNCKLISRGADTVSLWNYKNGMYYHARCVFEGAVDMVCPRGWCLIRDSQFFEIKETAALWHDGHYDPGQKFVIWNSSFDGVKGFQLGRHHYPCQFFFMNCVFSERMSPEPIYRRREDDPARDNPDYYGERIYFYRCRKDGEPFDWYKDNLNLAVDVHGPDQITPSWTFGGAWDPESERPVKVTGCEVRGKSMLLTFNEIVSVRGEPVIKSQSGGTFRISIQRYNDINKLAFESEENIDPDDLAGLFSMDEGAILASIASVSERHLEPFFRIPRLQIK